MILDSQEKLEKYLPFYEKIFANYVDSETYTTKVLESALKGFFDICTWYGVDKVSETAKDFKNIMETLFAFLDYDGKDNFQRMVDKQDRLKFVYEQYHSTESFDYEDPVRCDELLRSLTTEGFSKLLLLDRISFDSSFYDEILFRLIILFYSPDTMHQYLIRQCLTLFFSAFSSSPQPQHLESIKRMFVRCYKAILHADSDSIAHIDNLQLCSFLLSLTQPTNEVSQYPLRCKIHQQGADMFVDEIIENANDYSAQQLTNLSTLLNHCALVNAKYEVLEGLYEKVVEAVSSVPQVQVKKVLTKCQTAVQKLMNETDPPTESDDEENENENVNPNAPEDFTCISLRKSMEKLTI